MTPEQLAKSGTESGHQRAVFAWCALNKKQHHELDLLFHIPNGGARGDTAKARAIRGAAMKAEGVKPGVADLFLPVARKGYHGLWIELKKPGEKVKAGSEQEKFGLEMIRQGYVWYWCDNWLDAVNILKEYLDI